MEYGKVRPVYMDYILMFIGTAIMALGVNTVYEPSSLVTGGFTGAGIIIKEVTSSIMEGGVPIWLTNIVLNIPVFLLGAKIKGMKFLKRTLIATVFLSGWLYIIPVIPIGVEDLILTALFGGGLFGIGLGLVFTARATTGGTDMVAALIQHYLRQYSIVQVMQIVDAVIVIIGAYIFGITAALYAIIAIVVTSHISDYIIEGGKFAKVAYIVTDYQKEVADAVLHELGRGLTGWNAKGMYSEELRNVLFCVVSKKEIVALKECIAGIDENAFIVVSDAREVLGEGFMERKD